MFKVQVKISKFSFDTVKFNKTLRERLNVQVRNAAREFVRAAIVNIPVDTGEARGTFLPLGRFLNIAVPINGDPEPDKNPTTGAGPDKQLLFTFPSNQYGVYFQIDWQLFHFWFNEFFETRSNHYKPWDSIEAGREAFLEYMRTVAPLRLPKLKDFITASYLDSSGGKVN